MFDPILAKEMNGDPLISSLAISNTEFPELSISHDKGNNHSSP